MVLGGAVYFAKSLYEGRQQQQRVDEQDEDMLLRGMLDTPAEFLAKQVKLYGMTAPTYNFATARVPWDTNNPPYHIQRYGAATGEVTPSDIKQAYVNAMEHQRKDTMEQISHGRQAIMRQSNQPQWGGFTAEVHNPMDPRMKTQHMQWSWLPSAPTDSDFADAAALAKALPPNPLLFTPDSWFMTAPGLPFRYSY